MTGISGVQVPTGDMTDHHAVPAAHSGDRPAVHDVRVILAAPSHHPAVFLPRLPDLPRPVGTPAFLAHAPPTGQAPTSTSSRCSGPGRMPRRRALTRADAPKNTSTPRIHRRTAGGRTPTP
ncbi:hypothetical protein WKI71_36165 [Streptomyces sp. MS1.AVA.1]|uniref:Uncharacterized protein n=1 Tax=Streptomyces machairae TaxID=3134109 RepID=A0ABU8USD6_9ACTN